MGQRIDLQRHHITLLAPRRAGLEARPVGHDDGDLVIVGVDVLLHGPHASARRALYASPNRLTRHRRALPCWGQALLLYPTHPAGREDHVDLDEQAFEAVAEAALGRIESVLEDEADDLEVDRQGGVLTIETADGATFVLNKHAPLRQLWLSSPVSGASHYDYDADRKRWISTRGGRGPQRRAEPRSLGGGGADARVRARRLGWAGSRQRERAEGSHAGRSGRPGRRAAQGPQARSAQGTRPFHCAAQAGRLRCDRRAHRRGGRHAGDRSGAASRHRSRFQHCERPAFSINISLPCLASSPCSRRQRSGASISSRGSASG